MKSILLGMALLASSTTNASVEKIFTNQQTFPFGHDGRTLEGVSRNTIYLTFDDGPNPEVTPIILDTLKEYGIKATFFEVGNVARAHQAVVAEVRSEGHRIANHSYRHELSFSSDQDFLNTLINTDNVLETYMHDEDIRLFRAPGGNWHNYQALAANGNEQTKKYVGPIYWNVGGGDGNHSDDADWKCWTHWYVSTKRCGRSYLKQIENNYNHDRASIVLMHDINRKSAEMLKYILKQLKKKNVDWKFELIENIPSVQKLHRQLQQ